MDARQTSKLARDITDKRGRGRLADLGHRMRAINYSVPLNRQIEMNSDVFGAEK
jgi:hypothetical protein